MNIALFRDDMLAIRASMPPHARGIRAVEAMCRMLTTAELAFECELEQALKEALERDPDFALHGGLV